MTLTTEDRLAIHELINLHGHLMDNGEWERLPELFTADVVYDLTPLGLGVGELKGMDAIREAGLAFGERNPLGHHVTNVVVTSGDADVAQVISKGLAVMTGGAVGSATYHDEVRREPQGWRIARRVIVPRRRPLEP